MQADEVKQLIESAIEDAEAMVSSDGSHFEVTVVSPRFEGMTPVAEQKMIYAILGEQITSGAIHAINIKAYTPEEWQRAQQLQISR